MTYTLSCDDTGILRDTLIRRGIYPAVVEEDREEDNFNSTFNYESVPLVFAEEEWTTVTEDLIDISRELPNMLIELEYCKDTKDIETCVGICYKDGIKGGNPFYG